MKILKRAKQKNFKLDTSYYTKSEIEQMYDEWKIFNFKEGKIDDDAPRVGTVNISEVKIVCDDDGYYIPVAILKTGETIHIEL